MTIEIVKWIQQFRTEFLDDFFNFISYLGEENIYIILLVIIYFAYDKKFGEYLGFLLITALGFNTILKHIFKAQRPFVKYPDEVENIRPHTSPGYSFPSGHTQTFSTVLYGIAIYIKKRSLTIIVVILTILMAISRMYLGVHFLEDVLVSLLLGLAMSIGMYRFFKRFENNDKAIYILYGITLSILMIAMFFIQTKTIVTTTAMFGGFFLAMYVEKTYVNFSNNVPLLHRALRVIIGIVSMLAIQTGLKEIFLFFTGGQEYLILDFIRYFTLVFVGLGLLPMLFKKINI